MRINTHVRLRVNLTLRLHELSKNRKSLKRFAKFLNIKFNAMKIRLALLAFLHVYTQSQGRLEDFNRCPEGLRTRIKSTKISALTTQRCNFHSAVHCDTHTKELQSAGTYNTAVTAFLSIQVSSYSYPHTIWKQHYSCSAASQF
jgi:hypothetical protein